MARYFDREGTRAQVERLQAEPSAYRAIEAHLREIARAFVNPAARRQALNALVDVGLAAWSVRCHRIVRHRARLGQVVAALTERAVRLLGTFPGQAASAISTRPWSVSRLAPSHAWTDMP
jgi:hypothetical protein